MVEVKKSAILILIISFVFAISAGFEIPYLAFYTIIGGIVISWLWCRYVSKSLIIHQKIDGNNFHVGDIIQVQSFLDNDSLFPVPNVEIVNRTEEKITFEEPVTTLVSILPMGREIITGKLTAKYRGIHYLGPIDVEVNDALGIFKFKRRIYSDSVIKIYPKVYDLMNFNLRSMQAYGTVTTKQKAYEDNTVVSDIRKYYPGDSIKKVHWKVSAKKGGIFVKNYEMNGSAVTNIFMDFNRDSFKGENVRELEERAVEAGASIISYMLKNDVPVELYVNSTKLNFTKGRDIKEITKFLDVLCEVKPVGNKRMGEVLEKRIRLISRGSSIIVITGDIDEKDCAAYCGIKSLGYDLIVVYVSDFKVQEKVEKMLSSSGIIRYDVDSKSNIKGVLERV